MQRSALVVFVLCALCAVGTEAARFNPKKAMRHNGPVSPFPIEPSPAPTPTAPSAAAAPAPATASNPIVAVNALVDKYFQMCVRCAACCVLLLFAVCCV
jgi:hypothetical protein